MNAGIAWGSFDPVTSTVVDGVIGSATVPLVNAAGQQKAGPFGFGGGIEGGYNWQSGNWVAGIEGDIDYLHLNFPAAPMFLSRRRTPTRWRSGYMFLRAPGAKLGAFVGYNFFTEQMLAHGCTQVAGDDTCAPASPVTELFTSNDIQFNSLRVCLSAEFMLSDRVKFVADAA